MISLSAIRQMMPALGSLPTPQVDGLTAGGKIPMAELQQLASGPSAGATSISDLRPVSPQTDFGVAGPAQSGESFSGVLGRLVNEVSSKQAAAGDAVRDLQSGRNVSLHQAVIAMEEASVSFQLMVEVRNKLLESYQELMRMQI